ncbi:hypothetical protein SAV14893_085820 [Streptomyces avermitilis]|uniref:Phytanoyl-CoA dioxygenase n=1 Tax=Streptomyces avermitilis TaxID=33903 RepID=A0A4D4MC14_STRAX|nr:hypothetical protein [Streptomyces avermitilis]GDY69189.1 hypothetical protein SAV14893_085820 [Streptomyces avermitilis]
MDFVTIDDPSVKSRLERDGVVLIDSLLSKDEVAETRAQLERYEREVLADVPVCTTNSMRTAYCAT